MCSPVTTHSLIWRCLAAVAALLSLLVAHLAGRQFMLLQRPGLQSIPALLSPTPLSESIWLPVSERLDEFENRVWEEMIERHKLFQPIFLVSDAALRLCENPAAASLTVKVKTHKSVLAVCAPAAPASCCSHAVDGELVQSN